MTDPISGLRQRSIRLNYTVVPNAPVAARFEGVNARCGKCNRKLGEFLKADGVIQCPKQECRAMNTVKI